MSHPNPLVQAVIDAAQVDHGDGFCEELREALNTLPSSDDFKAARQQVAEHIPLLESAIGAGSLAVWLGAGVEQGANPEATAPPLIEALLRWCRTIETAPEDSEADDPEADEDVLRGMERIGQGLVAHLSRTEPVRQQLASRQDAVAEFERVQHLSIGVQWVLELLRKCSGELLVIHVPSHKAVRVTYANLSNCFHLFTLLQHELAGVIPGAKRAPADVIATATGKAQEMVSDQSLWHFGRGDVPEANVAASVWGEATPASIPEINGVQVLLLWPCILGSRSWDAGFFGPILESNPPNVRVIAELTSDEVNEWWQRLKLPTATAESKRPWWKFW